MLEMCQNGAKNPCRSLLDCVLGYWGSLDKNYTEKMVKSVKIVKRILVNSLLVFTWFFGDDQMWTSLKTCGKVSEWWKNPSWSSELDFGVLRIKSKESQAKIV
jgi:hypothetical protein